jgi:hypothetical protein
LHIWGSKVGVKHISASISGKGTSSEGFRFSGHDIQIAFGTSIQRDWACIQLKNYNLGAIIDIEWYADIIYQNTRIGFRRVYRFLIVFEELDLATSAEDYGLI